MKWVRVTLLMMSLSGCSVLTGSTFTTTDDQSESESLSRSEVLDQHLEAEGRLEIIVLLHHLMQREIVRDWPRDSLSLDGPLTEQIPVTRAVRVGMVIAEIERRCGWVFDLERQTFYRAHATHSIDGPDAFGRPSSGRLVPREGRPMVAFEVRFRRLTGGGSLRPWTAQAGATQNYFSGSLPDGVAGSWSSVSERSFFEGVRDPEGGELVTTQRRSVSAGLSVRGIAARLPGGLFRIDGELEIASFVGGSLDRAVVGTPLQVDGPRGEWVRVLVVRGGDISAQAALRQLGFRLNGTSEAVEVAVRVQ